MNALRTFNPWQELNDVAERVNRVFGRTPFQLPAGPAVNVVGAEDSLVLTAELPGLDLEKLDISVERDVVTIRGERVGETLGDGESWIRRERPAGQFERVVRLPFEVDGSTAEAVYEQGVLTLTLHRPEEQKPRRISVRRV